MFNLNENIHVMNKFFHIVNSGMSTDKAFPTALRIKM